MLITIRLLAALAVIAGLLAPMFAPSFTFATLPANELWREALVNDVVGFGKNTTGGKGGNLCQVTNLNDSGAGSLRSCAESTNTYWIVFNVSGTITLQSTIVVRSNKTIDGRGANITLTTPTDFVNGDHGYGMFEIGSWNFIPGPISNVIIENLKFQDNYGNGMIVIGENASDIWIDHNTFQNSVDEEIGISSGGKQLGSSNNITISWNYFPASNPKPGDNGPCTAEPPPLSVHGRINPSWSLMRPNRKMPGSISPSTTITIRRGCAIPWHDGPPCMPSTIGMTSPMMPACN